jgi:hypothetical protein
MRSVKAVAWSFLGIRKSSEFQEDIDKITPLHVLGVGLVAVFLFVFSLIVLVKLVVAQ